MAIVDLYLRAGEGIGMISGMCGSCPGVRVMVLTISDDPKDNARARGMGVDAVMNKAEDLFVILAAIRRLANG